MVATCNTLYFQSDARNSSTALKVSEGKEQLREARNVSKEAVVD
jgi:hypothetical protein